MTVDFRKIRSKPSTVSTLGEEVEVVEEYRYLRVYLDSRLDWKCKNATAQYTRKLDDARIISLAT